MRSDMIQPATVILHAIIPLLALLLLRLYRVARAAVAAAAFTGGGACCPGVHQRGLSLYSAAQPAAPAPLEPFSLAVTCFLVGWLVLRESIEDPRVLPPLGGAAAAIAVGVGAATLALLSRAPAAWLGLLGGPLGHPTIYALCALGGLFVRYTLARATLLHVGLAACAWFSVARGLAAGPDGPFLPAMVVLFLASAGIGLAWPRKRVRQA